MSFDSKLNLYIYLAILIAILLIICVIAQIILLKKILYINQNNLATASQKTPSSMKKMPTLARSDHNIVILDGPFDMKSYYHDAVQAFLLNQLDNTLKKDNLDTLSNTQISSQQHNVVQHIADTMSKTEPSITHAKELPIIQSTVKSQDFTDETHQIKKDTKASTIQHPISSTSADMILATPTDHDQQEHLVANQTNNASTLDQEPASLTIVDDANSKNTPIVDQEPTSPTVIDKTSNTPTLDQEAASLTIVDNTDSKSTPQLELVQPSSAIVDKTSNTPTLDQKPASPTIVDDANSKSTPQLELVQPSSAVIDKTSNTPTLDQEAASLTIVDNTDSKSTPQLELVQPSSAIVDKTNNTPALKLVSSNPTIVDDTDSKSTPQLELVQPSSAVINKTNNTPTLKLAPSSPTIVDDTNSKSTPQLELVQPSSAIVDKTSNTPTLDQEPISPAVIDKTNSTLALDLEEEIAIINSNALTPSTGDHSIDELLSTPNTMALSLANTIEQDITLKEDLLLSQQPENQVQSTSDLFTPRDDLSVTQASDFEIHFATSMNSQDAIALSQKQPNDEDYAHLLIHPMNLNFDNAQSTLDIAANINKKTTISLNSKDLSENVIIIDQKTPAQQKNDFISLTELSSNDKIPHLDTQITEVQELKEDKIGKSDSLNTNKESNVNKILDTYQKLTKMYK